jgi:hypothetical protein
MPFSRCARAEITYLIPIIITPIIPVRMNTLPQKPPTRLLLMLGSLTGLAFTSCSNDIVFAAQTSSGLEVGGDAAKVPTYVNFGFRRRELIYAGPQTPKNESLLGRIDSETSWTKGAAIRETFATGTAADTIADPTNPVTSKEPDKEISEPLVFVSRTRVGFGINLGGADDDAIPSTHLGYSRRIGTRVHTAGPDSTLPALVSDISVHTSGVQGIGNAGKNNLHPDATLSENGSNFGARIRQFFAIGKGADSVLASPADESGAPSLAEQPTIPKGTTTAAALREVIQQRSSPTQ